MNSIPPNYDMANRYLEALTGTPDGSVTFQFFSDTDKKNLKVATHRHMRRAAAYAFLAKKQKEGCGVYVMVNEGDGKGRKARNVRQVRALFIDLDGAPMEPTAGMLKPHIIVESSPGRFHLYWLVSDCTLKQFKPLQQAIAKQFNGDKSCVDLCRVLRVPGFYHLKNQPVMTELLEVNDFPRYTTQQIIDGLGLTSATVATIPLKSPRKQQIEVPALSGNNSYEYTTSDTGEVIDLTAWAAKNPHFDIVTALEPQYARGEVKEGKQHIQCPFEHEHSDDSTDLATFICNTSLPQFKSFEIHCMHDHCAGRDRLDFLKAMLEQGWLSTDLLHAPALQMKRPPKMYFPVNEIAAALEWSTLNADEFRIALHIAVLAWGSDDGTLPDDNWMIARRLGLSEQSWQSYRGTLKRTGWLIESDGRLTSSIIKREFDAAQKAYMEAIYYGSRGGKISALKRKSTPP